MVLAARHQHLPSTASSDVDLDEGFDPECQAFAPEAVEIAGPTHPRSHQVAEVSERGIIFLEALEPLDSRLRGLHRRIVEAVVRGGPLPSACETLPEADHLVARIEVEWNETMRAGSRRDPDLEQWVSCLLAATEGCFTAWCFACLCELSGGGLIRLDPDRPGAAEAWIAEEPELLAEDLATSLDGDRIPLAVDPLRRPEVVPFRASIVRQAS